MVSQQVSQVLAPGLQGEMSQQDLSWQKPLCSYWVVKNPSFRIRTVRRLKQGPRSYDNLKTCPAVDSTFQRWSEEYLQPHLLFSSVALTLAVTLH